MLTRHLSRVQTPMVLLLLGLPLLMAESSQGQTTNLYVSPTGKDQWSGRLAAPNGDSSDGPFATLQKARDTIRAMKKSTGCRSSA